MYSRGFVCIAAVILNVAIAQDACFESCGLEGADTKVMGTCLQRSIEDGGQGSSVQDAMLEIYDNVNAAGIQPGGIEEKDSILMGLNAAKPGETASNSEGLYYCISNNETGVDTFFWVLNCVVLKQGFSGDESLCVGLTTEEQEMPSVGYVVDALLLGDDKFHRYVFNSTTVISTESQPIEASGYSCSRRPWFTSTKCTDPLATTCSTTFQGSTGLGAFQHYGEVNTVVVGQDIREWQLDPCLGTYDTSRASFVSIVFVLMFPVLHVLILSC